MKLYALSDLHLRQPAAREALLRMASHPEDWLALVGDVGETDEHLRFALTTLRSRFAQLLWVPGNHELWTLRSEPMSLRGEARYRHLVQLCQQLGVLTPEDPYPLWPGQGPPLFIAPLFLLYDYSFHPEEVPSEHALAWAMEEGILCSDEALLHPDPYPSRQAWCQARCALTEARLGSLPPGSRTVLLNHFPLLQEHAVLPRIPRFSLWCGTRRTHDWHRRFAAEVVVYGHLHIRDTRWKDGVRFEEVSLGYPGQWRPERGVEAYLREILPGTGAARPPTPALEGG
jgi:predicted phosphodiesterase